MKVQSSLHCGVTLILNDSSAAEALTQR